MRGVARICRLRGSRGCLRNGTFRRRQLKFPLVREVLVIETYGLLAPRHETLALRFQRFRIAQAQDFDIEHQESGTLDRGYHLIPCNLQPLAALTA